MERQAEGEWAVVLGRYILEDARQRGYETAELERLQEEAEALRGDGQLERALEQACRVRERARRPLARRADWPYAEPRAGSEIAALWPRSATQTSHDWAHYERDVGNAWLGMTAGAALGLPLENWSAEPIAQEHGEIDGYVAHPPPTRTSFPVWRRRSSRCGTAGAISRGRCASRRCAVGKRISRRQWWGRCSACGAGRGDSGAVASASW